VVLKPDIARFLWRVEEGFFWNKNGRQKPVSWKVMNTSSLKIVMVRGDSLRKSDWYELIPLVY
jgi:hypothetical protein